MRVILVVEEEGWLNVEDKESGEIRNIFVFGSLGKWWYYWRRKERKEEKGF